MADGNRFKEIENEESDLKKMLAEEMVQRGWEGMLLTSNAGMRTRERFLGRQRLGVKSVEAGQTVGGVAAV